MSLTIDNLQEVLVALDEAKSKWFNLGLALKLKHPVLAGLRSKRREDNDICFREMLAKVLNTRSVTWTDLSDALRAPTVELNQLADSITNNDGQKELLLLASNETSDEGATPRKHDQSIESDLIISATLTAGKCSSIEEKAKALEVDFGKLADRAFSFFEGQNVKITTFKGKIFSAMDISLQATSFQYHLDDFFEKLDDDIQVAKAWMKLTHLWNYLNYELLKLVIQTFIPDDDRLKQDLQQYVESIDKFCSTTKIHEFFQICPFARNKPKEIKVKKIVAKTEHDWEKSTLQDIKGTSRYVAEIFTIPHILFPLDDVKAGCVSLHWYVPLSVAAHVESLKIQPDSMKEHKIISITVESVKIYSSILTEKVKLQPANAEEIYSRGVLIIGKRPFLGISSIAECSSNSSINLAI